MGLVSTTLQAVSSLKASRWAPFTRLVLIGEQAAWVVKEEQRELAAVARSLGVQVVRRHRPHGVKRQAVFFGSIHNLWRQREYCRECRIGGAYYHGTPGTGNERFDANYEALQRHHEEVDRVQVTNRPFRDVVLSTGIDPGKVFLIPIGINLSYLAFRTEELMRKARASYGIPESAFVVGSFQKDGQGWGEGNEPKLEKGPDIFAKTIDLLRSKIDNLFVLLVGPARGYVKSALARMDVAYRHVIAEDYKEIGDLYQCLDCYLVTAREEGGPRAVLEAMGAGVPLVSTKVGQARDLIQHTENGWLAEVDDVDALSHWCCHVRDQREADLDVVLKYGRRTAESNSYESQKELWRAFMKGFVAMEEGA